MNYTISNAEINFLNALRGAGLNIEQIEADGSLHRVPVMGDKHGQKSGAYIFYADGVPSGGFQNFKAGDWQSWSAKTLNTMSARERLQFQIRMQQVKRQKEAAELVRHDKRALFAKRIFNRGERLETHPYIERKKVAMPSLCRVGAFPIWNEELGKHEWKPDALLVPLYALHSNQEESVFGGWNIQAIFENGDKRFLAGARKRGCFHPLHSHASDWDSPSVVLITEGIATAATVHMLDKHPTLAALDAGNLIHVAKAARKAWANADIIIAGDDDHQSPNNVGRTKAIEAASAIRGRFVFPDFSEEEKLKGLTDWNDYAISRGLL